MISSVFKDVTQKGGRFVSFNVVLANKGAVSIDEVIRRILNKFNLSSIEEIKDTRKLERLLPYYLISYYLRNVEKLSYPQICKYVHRTDHTTIINATTKASYHLKNNPKIREAYLDCISENFTYKTVDNDLKVCYVCINPRKKEEYLGYKSGNVYSNICRYCANVRFSEYAKIRRR